MERHAEISYQIGSGFDQGQGLVWSLRRNTELLEERAIYVPRPRLYQKDIADAVISDDESPAFSQRFQNIVHQHAERVFLTDTFLMESDPALWDGVLWCPNLGAHAAKVRRLFADARMRFFISIRRPDRLLADAIENGADLARSGETPDPFTLSWVELISDIRNHVPDVPVTVWCAEDISTLWSRIMTEAIGLPTGTRLDGALDPLASVLTAEGLERLKLYLARRTDFSADMRARVISVFTTKFLSSDAAQRIPELPGWNMENEARMAAQYATEIATLATMDGVDFLAAPHRGADFSPMRVCA